MSQSKPVDVEQMILEGTLIDEAMRRAVEDTLRLHKKLGMPVVGWKDGKAVWIPAEEIEVDEERDA